MSFTMSFYGYSNVRLFVALLLYSHPSTYFIYTPNVRALGDIMQLILV